jgi:hypothetical protein
MLAGETRKASVDSFTMNWHAAKLSYLITEREREVGCARDMHRKEAWNGDRIHCDTGCDTGCDMKLGSIYNGSFTIFAINSEKRRKIG